MIYILKLDHRPFRDKRITTHCALVSRAFGANRFYYSGIEDDHFEKSVIEINKQWGGKFKTIYTTEPQEIVTNFKGIKIHLTMYGIKIINKINEIIKEHKKQINLLIIVGGPKVENFYYENANYNLSVTNQPHSEVAALAIILNYLNPDALFTDSFKNTKIKIDPCNKGKKVISLK